MPNSHIGARIAQDFGTKFTASGGAGGRKISKTLFILKARSLNSWTYVIWESEELQIIPSPVSNSAWYTPDCILSDLKHPKLNTIMLPCGPWRSRGPYWLVCQLWISFCGLCFWRRCQNSRARWATVINWYNKIFLYNKPIVTLCLLKEPCPFNLALFEAVCSLSDSSSRDSESRKADPARNGVDYLGVSANRRTPNIVP